VAAPTSWVLAEGYVGNQDDTDTYLLVANPSDTAAHVTFDLVGNQYEPGVRTVVTCNKVVAVAPHSRYTAGLKALCQPDLGAPHQITIFYGGVVSSDGPGIVVERSTYTSTFNQFWAAGSSTALTKLPPP